MNEIILTLAILSETASIRQANHCFTSKRPIAEHLTEAFEENWDTNRRHLPMKDEENVPHDKHELVADKDLLISVVHETAPTFK